MLNTLRKTGRRMALTLIAVSASTAIAHAEPGPAAQPACGTAGADRTAAIAALADPAAFPAEDSRATVEALNDRDRAIAGLLLDAGDRRGLFAFMFATATEVASLPALDGQVPLRDTGAMAAVIAEYQRAWLRNLHADLTGAAVDPHWARYFELAADCSEPAGYAAMSGYNAHMTIDIPFALAGVGVRQDRAADVLAVLDRLAVAAPEIVDRTYRETGVDVGPFWRLYFFGEGLDRIAGDGVATGMLRRGGIGAFGAVSVAMSSALLDPATRPAAETQLDSTWQAGDIALGLLADMHGF